MTPLHHAMSSALTFGGLAEDYIEIHKFIDISKTALPRFAHRVMLHHAMGIEVVVRVFGESTRVPGVGEVPTRLIAERHIVEDLGRVPSFEEVVNCLTTSRQDKQPILSGIKGYNLRKSQDIEARYNAKIRQDN